MLTSVAPENKYRYNGKEWNDEWGLNMYDYGARGYMPDLGRWGGVDALAEDFHNISLNPYHFVANNRWHRVFRKQIKKTIAGNRSLTGYPYFVVSDNTKRTTRHERNTHHFRPAKEQ